MTIPPVTGSIATSSISAPSQTAGSRGGAAPTADITDTFQGALESVGDALAEADLMSQQVATGEISDLSQLTAAVAKAQLSMDVTVAFRDRAVDSFTQIMQMQV